MEQLFEIDRKIKSLKLYSYDLPMKKLFTIANYTINSKKLLLVCLKTHEAEGWAEVPVFEQAFYIPESLAGDIDVFHRMQNYIVSKEWNIKALNDWLNIYFKGHWMLKAGIIHAFISSFIAEERINLPLKLGMDLQISIPLDTNINEWLDEAKHQGIKSFKLKIRPGSLITVSRLREKIGGAYLSVDANASFDPFNEKHWNELIKIAEHVNLIEQPFPAETVNKAIELSQTTGVPVALDESITSAAAWWDVADERLVLNVKPPRMGGIYEVYKALNKGSSKGPSRSTNFFIGGLLETEIGRSLNLLVLLLRRPNYPSDFSLPSEFYTEPISDASFSIEGGRLYANLDQTAFYPRDEIRKKLRPV